MCFFSTQTNGPTNDAITAINVLYKIKRIIIKNDHAMFTLYPRYTMKSIVMDKVKKKKKIGYIVVAL